MAPSVYAMAQKGDLITGKNQNTLGGQLLSQVTGLSPETANFVYSLPSLYTGAKPILGATARLGNQVVAERESNGICYGVCSWRIRQGCCKWLSGC